MVSFIPPYYGDEVKSNAEKKMFEILQDLNVKNTYVLHSLGLPRHNNKVYGEVDFVVLCEKGIACLEIKGGRIECTDGQWIFKNRHGKEFKKSEGPFAQVSGNMFSLKKILAERFNYMDKFKDIPVACGVVFPDIKFTSKGQEIIPEIIYDQSTSDITDYINNVFDYWNNRSYRKKMELTGNDIQSILGYLRGEFTFIPSIGSQLNDVDQKLIRLTSEQANTIHGLSQNDRLMIEGPAGTGKTLLAMEYAKMEAQKDKTILYLTYNKNLAKELQRKMGDIENIRVINIDRLMGEYVKIESEEVKKDFTNYFKQLLPQKVVSYINGLTNDELAKIQYDIIVIDEGQDIFSPNYLEVIDRLLKGGLEDGRWGFFYDEEQNIYNPQYEDGIELLALYKPARFRLSTNCRNTVQIGEYNAKISGIPVKSYLSERGEEVQIIGGKPEDFPKRFVKVIKELKNGDVKLGDITILSHKKYENSSVYGLLDKICQVNVMTDDFVYDEDKPIFSTIQGFKGLDSKVVILVDLMSKSTEEYYSKYAYIGISRARSMLYVIG